MCKIANRSPPLQRLFDLWVRMSDEYGQLVHAQKKTSCKLYLMLIGWDYADNDDALFHNLLNLPRRYSYKNTKKCEITFCLGHKIENRREIHQESHDTQKILFALISLKDCVVGV